MQGSNNQKRLADSSLTVHPQRYNSHMAKARAPETERQQATVVSIGTPRLVLAWLKSAGSELLAKLIPHSNRPSRSTSIKD